MNFSRIDKIIQYALVVASGLDDYRQRELGPIHFIKYVYLADLAYANEHSGQTYTETPWRFHHFGPWSETVFERVEPALLAIGSQKVLLPCQHGDFARWNLRAVYNCEVLASQLERDLGFIVALNVKKAVQTYGSDTYNLLNDVYLSQPMLIASPGEHLDFSTTCKQHASFKGELSKPDLSAKQLKKRAQKREALKAAFLERLAKKNAARNAAKANSSMQPPARYDAIFSEGLRVLDALGGTPIQEESLTCSISDNIWKSKARHDPDLS